jgi:two-component system cell cycle response regulator DivK
LPRLLYVEDNEDNLYMLTLFFDVQGGYEILSAATGAEGIASAIAETRHLKADPATRDIPIIALTAHAMAGDREKALATGCDDFDTKPVEFDRLLAKIEQALAKKRGEPGSRG